MRTETEVRELLAMLRTHMDHAERKISQGVEFQEWALVFNRNSEQVSVLEWVLGGDTIRVTRA